MFPTKFQFIWLRSFRGEDQHVKSYRTTDDRQQTTDDRRRTTDATWWQKLTFPLARWAKNPEANTIDTTCVADITVNILTGILPIEAQLHIRALGLFNNICNQLESSAKKSLARRQLLIKNNKGVSWFTAIKHMLRKYDIKEVSWYLDNQVKKTLSTSIVKKNRYTVIGVAQ
jgi:hypothetical protein